MVVEADEPIVSQSLLYVIVLYQKLDQDMIKRFENIIMFEFNFMPWKLFVKHLVLILKQSRLSACLFVKEIL